MKANRNNKFYILDIDLYNYYLEITVYRNRLVNIIRLK